MEIAKEKKENINILKIKGRLDAGTAGSLEESLTTFNDEPKVRVLLDCQELEYISSAGLRVLLASAKELKKTGGKIGLIALNPNVKQVFEISGFTSIFPIYEDPKQALTDLKK